MKPHAVCVRCGSEKRRPFHVCPTCGLDPATEDELLVRSVYLSQGRYDDPDEAEAYAEQLRRDSEAIRAGREVVFDQAELRRLAAQIETVRAVPVSAVWRAVFRLFLPALIFLLVLFGLLYVLRSAG